MGIKKYIKNTKLCLVFAAVATLTGCSDNDDFLESSKQLSFARICHVNLALRQGGRISLNPTSYLKDSANVETVALPVSCEKMATLEPGDSLVDKFRWGSLFMSGSLSSWKMDVINVPRITNPTDLTSCKVRLGFSQNRISLDPTQYIKDAVNSLKLNWEFPCSVYKEIEEGHDFVEDDFRVGSLFVRGSVGTWNLKVIKKLERSPSSYQTKAFTLQ